MQLMKSIIAKRQTFLLKHFKGSKYARKLRKLKNIHKGEICFIIGNGPSLKTDDLEKLKAFNIDTFAANRIYKIFDKTLWKPTYFSCEDPIIIKDIEKDINKIDCKYKFIPINLKWDLGIDIKNAYYINMTYNKNDNINKNLDERITCSGTVTITSIQLAAYMGYKEIYLLGVDHNYSKMINEQGQVVEDKTVKNYFDDSYDNGIKDELVHNMDEATKSFYKTKIFYEKNNVKIYNATRGGKLEVFPRVDIDKFFEEMSGK